ncbi:MAG: heavy metal-responsive transcriptional regulator [Gammaproteobacteria bacterium]|nr:MAG: heavy metal-responsive transcriptional regulator [Gammaproteobacteria bacterium]
MIKISKVAQTLNISADTLRYYEKINLLPPISRTKSGIRLYSDKNLSQIKFIKRAQTMSFSLAEIAQLLEFRKAPQQAKPEVRLLAKEKLSDIEQRVKTLQSLQVELTLLINLCHQSEGGCPILSGIETDGGFEK